MSLNLRRVSKKSFFQFPWRRRSSQFYAESEKRNTSQYQSLTTCFSQSDKKTANQIFTAFNAPDFHHCTMWQSQWRNTRQAQNFAFPTPSYRIVLILRVRCGHAERNDDFSYGRESDWPWLEAEKRMIVVRKKENLEAKSSKNWRKTSIS